MRYNIAEFFVGADGSYLGFMQEDFSTLYINDFDSNALKALEHNSKKHLQNAILDSTDITQLNSKELKKKVDSSVDMMFGDIVCKGFSLAGERNSADERNQFYRYCLDIIKEPRPKISVVENVKGMLNARILNPNAPSEIWQEVGNIWKQLELLKGEKSALGKKDKITQQVIQKGEMLRKQKQNLLEEVKPYQISVLDDIYKIYEAMGYKAQHKVLNAVWYGAATKQERLIIVATRADLQGDFHYPLPRFYDESIGTKLDFSGDELAKCKLKKLLTLREVLAKIDYTNENDIDNLPMQYNAKTIEQSRYIKEGCNIADSLDLLPRHLQISKSYSGGGNTRLHSDRLAPTLVSGHSALPLHPKEHRSTTIREAAIITGFPLEYKFFGSHTKRCE